ncbi:MAG: DbpA RNA binding domain-containing protein [Planctomycetota bacterium]
MTEEDEVDEVNVEAEVDALDEAPLVQFKQALLDTLTEGGLELYQDLIEEVAVESGQDVAVVAAAAARLARRAQAPNSLERIAGFELDSVGKLDQRTFVPRPAAFDGGAQRRGGDGYRREGGDGRGHDDWRGAPRRGGFGRGGFGRGGYDRAGYDRAGYDRDSDRGGYGRERGDDFERGPRRDQKPVEAGMTRLFVSIGRMDGVRPGDLVGAIAGESGIEGSSIGAIDIYSRYSFVEVPERQGDRVIRAISGATVRGRQVTARPALPPGERPARPAHLSAGDGEYED